MSEPVRVLLIDENTTVRRCMRQALEVLGAWVVEYHTMRKGSLPADPQSAWGGAAPELVILDCQRFNERSWQMLGESLDKAAGRVSVIFTCAGSVQVPEHIGARQRVSPVMPKPFTPRQLCFAAFMALPRLRPHNGEPPFPRSEGVEEALYSEQEAPATVAMAALPRPTKPRKTPSRPAFADSAWSFDAGTSLDVAPVTVGSVLDDNAPPGPSLVSMEEVSLGEGGSLEIREISEDEMEFIDADDILEIDEISGDAMMEPPLALSIRTGGASSSGERIALSSGEVEALSVTEPGVSDVARALSEAWSVLSRSSTRLALKQEIDAVVHHAQTARRQELERVRAVRGDLEAQSVMEVLSRVRDEKRSGTLTLEGESRGYRLVLRGDALVSVEALHNDAQKSLSAILVEFGCIEERTLHRFLDRPGVRRSDLGEALLEANLISEGDLGDVSWIQAERNLTEAIKLQKGTFVWTVTPGREYEPANPAHPSVTGLVLGLLASGSLSTPLISLDDGDLVARNNRGWHRCENETLRPEYVACLELAMTGKSWSLVKKSLYSPSLDLDPEDIASHLLMVGLLEVVS